MIYIKIHKTILNHPYDDDEFQDYQVWNLTNLLITVNGTMM